ncbi:MAG: hypothetical protein ACE5DW_07325, partial [Thermodesulfobacteriota bacterium]
IKDSSTVPPWVLTTPREAGAICAVGMSEPTFYSDDAKGYAAESARKELARTLNMRISNIMVDISTEKGSDVDEATVTRVSSWTADAVLHESTIKEFWLDSGGTASNGIKNITYALACMPLSSIKDGVHGEGEIGRRIIDELKR